MAGHSVLWRAGGNSMAGPGDRGEAWFVQRPDGLADSRFGPHTRDELRNLAARGLLQPGDQVWNPGLASWVPAGQLEGVFPPARPSAPAVRTPKRRAAWLLPTILTATILLAGLAAVLGVSLTRDHAGPQPPVGQTHNSGPVSSSSGTGATGALVNVAQAGVGPEGGTMAVHEKGPLEGLQIEVPAGAYPQQTDFKISYTPVGDQTIGSSHQLGSPLIHIDNGGVFAQRPVRVRIPVAVPAGYFATASFYDRDTGILEALPVVDVTTTSLSVVTCHFSDMVVELDQPSNLPGKTTDFIPGVDDWQFKNPSTILDAEGSCDGWCLSALYYFRTFVADPGSDYEARPGADRLFLRFANGTPQLWEDDAAAIRFVASVQRDLSQRKIDMVGEYTGAEPTKTADEVRRQTQGIWNGIVSALQNNQPQLIKLTTKTGGAHEVIAFGYTYDSGTNAGSLQLCDPNHPGVAQILGFSNGAFLFEDSPVYRTFVSLEQDSTTALFDWDKLKERWSQFEAGKAGEGTFPVCRVQYRDAGKLTDLVDKMSIRNLKDDKLDLQITAVETQRTAAGTRSGVVELTPQMRFLPQVYRDDAWLVKTDFKSLSAPSAFAFTLKPGPNHIGLEIVVDDVDHYQGSFVDFKWLDINYEKTPVKPHKTQVRYFNDDPQNGPCEIFEYYDGPAGAVKDGRDCELDGLGRLEKETTYADGRRQGPYREWAIGCLVVEANYENDQLNGTYREYNSPGGTDTWVTGYTEQQYKDGQAMPGSYRSVSTPKGATSNLSLQINNGVFDKTVITADPGSKVTINVLNNDWPGIDHVLSFYLDSACTQTLASGTDVLAVDGKGWKTFTYFFVAPAEPGTYYFRCDQHSNEIGTLVVR
jgi:hypothetical protein